MNLVNVRKKQMKGLTGPQIYTCTIEFTEEELEGLVDNMVVEIKPGVVEDLTSHVLSRFAKPFVSSPISTTTVSPYSTYTITA